MKKLITCKLCLLFTVFLFPTLCSFQISDSLKSPSTKLARVQIEVGKIIKKEYVEFVKFESKGMFVNVDGGDCIDINFQLIKITDAATQAEYKGIYISSRSYPSLRNYYGYIDEDEIPALMKFLDLVLKVIKQNSETEVEYIFNSNDLTIFCANEMSNKKGKENKWKCVIDLDKYYSEGLIISKMMKLMFSSPNLKKNLAAINCKIIG